MTASAAGQTWRCLRDSRLAEEAHVRAVVKEGLDPGF